MDLKNPQVLRLVKIFGESLVKSGMLKPLGSAAREAGEAVESALPRLIGGGAREAGEAARYTQRSLIGDLQRTQPGRSVYGPKVSPADVDYRAMLRPSPRAADVPSLPAPAPRGQLSLFEAGPAPVPAFKTTPVQGPISRTAEELYASDPGTYRSISELARRASAYYGKPVSVDDLVAPGGTKFLQNLEENLRGAAGIVRSPGGAMRPPTAGGAVDLAERGGSLVRSPGGNLAEYIKNIRGAADETLDVDVRDISNAMGGVRQGNLGKLGLALGIPGGFAAAFLAGRGTTPEPAAPEAPLQTPMGPTTESADAGGVVNDPQAAQNRQANLAGQIAASMSPGARANIPAPTYRGADGQTVITQRGEDEALTAAKQQYARPQNALAAEYARRRQFAEDPRNKAQIISQLAQRGVLDTPELVAWAGQNPALAYDLLRKAGGGTLPSQQVPQPVQKVITAPAGSNTANNMIGNTAATAEATLGGTQGASDLRGFTSPQFADEVQRLDPALIYALQGRNLI